MRPAGDSRIPVHRIYFALDDLYQLISRITGLPWGGTREVPNQRKEAAGSGSHRDARQDAVELIGKEQQRI